MKIWHFIRSETDIPASRIVAMATLSGLSNTLLLAIINAAANTASMQESERHESTRLFLFFLGTIVLYIASQRYILRISNVEVERLVGRLRTRLADRIRRSDLLPLENIGKGEIYAVVNRDTQTLSQAASPIIIALQSSIMLLFTIGYIALLRVEAFVLTVVIVGVGSAIHFRLLRPMMADHAEATKRENQFFGSLTHVLEGFKEVKLHRPRSEDLNRSLREIVDRAVAMRTRTGRRFADHFVFSQTTLYVLIAAMVFLLPKLSADTYSDVVMRVTAAILFMIGPLTNLIGMIPTFSTANVAVENLIDLEAQLARLERQARDRDENGAEALTDFDRIELDRVRFAYRDPDDRPLFEVGPIDLTIQKGELVFFVGGNGSGKSTFLKLLTALYYPDSGSIQLDGEDVADTGYVAYRSLFSAIFSDYHLFDRLFGLPDVTAEEVAEMLELMQLTQKTKFVDGRFVNQELSTGQRKRLALIVTMLEDRPICVFDEWAADQDPGFREFFYRTLIPQMQARGKTVIAATHDDRYFEVADRVLKMDAGKLVPYEP